MLKKWLAMGFSFLLIATAQAVPLTRVFVAQLRSNEVNFVALLGLDPNVKFTRADVEQKAQELKKVFDPALAKGKEGDFVGTRVDATPREVEGLRKKIDDAVRVLSNDHRKALYVARLTTKTSPLAKFATPTPRALAPRFESLQEPEKVAKHLKILEEQFRIRAYLEGLFGDPVLYDPSFQEALRQYLFKMATYVGPVQQPVFRRMMKFSREWSSFLPGEKLKDKFWSFRDFPISELPDFASNLGLTETPDSQVAFFTAVLSRMHQEWEPHLYLPAVALTLGTLQDVEVHLDLRSAYDKAVNSKVLLDLFDDEKIGNTLTKLRIRGDFWAHVLEAAVDRFIALHPKNSAEAELRIRASIFGSDTWKDLTSPEIKELQAQRMEVVVAENPLAYDGFKHQIQKLADNNRKIFGLAPGEYSKLVTRLEKASKKAVRQMTPAPAQPKTSGLFWPLETPPAKAPDVVRIQAAQAATPSAPVATGEPAPAQAAPTRKRAG